MLSVRLTNPVIAIAAEEFLLSRQVFARISRKDIFLMKIAIFWDIAPCSPYMSRHFGGTYQNSAELCLATWSRWFFARMIFDLKMEAIGSSEMSVHIRTTRRYIPEDGNFHNYRCENLRSYIIS
jgi:hypothetical protein